jgi:hypothetical protein
MSSSLTGPTGHGDECKGGHRAGCVDLLLEIQNRIKPKYHVFGTQFTCFTGTKLQILTPEELQATCTKGTA